MDRSSKDYFGTNLFIGSEMEDRQCASEPEHVEAADPGCISGKIIGVSESNYHRIWLRKVYDKLAYGQRMSDVVNTAIVRSKDGEGKVVDTHFYIYGKLGSGVSELKVGSNVTGKGRYDSKHRFLVRRLTCDGVLLNVQLEKNDILWWLFPALTLAFLFLMPGMAETILQNSMVKETILRFLVLFLGIFAILMKLIGRKMRYRVSLGKRIKVCGWISFIMSFLIMRIF